MSKWAFAFLICISLVSPFFLWMTEQNLKATSKSSIWLNVFSFVAGYINYMIMAIGFFAILFAIGYFIFQEK